MRRFLRFTSVVALALIGVSGTVTAKSAERPFEGTLSGEVNFVPAPECPLGLRTVPDAVGPLSHLGKTVTHSEHCTPPGDYIEFGEMTLTAANGDMVEIQYNGFAPFPTPTTEVIHVEGDLLITDGTGRFAAATGGRFDVNWSTFNYTADLEFPGFGPGGPLPGPYPTVWYIGPMTIGY